MTDDDSCCSPTETDATVSKRPAPGNICPQCARAAKPVQGQTVKALLSVSLRVVQDIEYFFCETQACPVVYFSADGAHTLMADQIRERVYQKEADDDNVLICYCFRHTLGDVRLASLERRAAILADINAGVQAGQCACDLRNPQGTCCLGNVRSLIKELGRQPLHVA